MNGLNDPNQELRTSKQRYLTLFYIVLVSNFITRLPTPRTPAANLLGIVGLCLAIAFVIHTFLFSRALGNGIAKTVFMVLLSFVPLINLLVVLRLVKKYSAVTGIPTNFFMFDSPPSASEAA